ncbi:TATA-binding protein associated factor Taf2 [Gaeumannomyces tritici R3-111a-1]|uniref:Transcription initiation factor TFIID subunit 2 n=1 Tax=Gaeumannomyces tritici (strain R3-111a-1) TaxID=644352 RepID=J3P465_GAET3|nr:TATA-binding protein associated factor Taf2 [Gaeumannomyces tritici R3-111a-1]EJT74461.1 TATA-binding protein associated factor Taf2 [Gaeumannomyces tritici R3-111a-1]
MPAMTGSEPLLGEQSQAADTWQQFDVVNQQVELDINFRDKVVSGVVKMTIFAMQNEIESVRIDARQMEIDTNNVLVNGNKVKAVYHDPYERVDIPANFDWDASQFPYQMARIEPLLPRQDRDAPVSGRGMLGCAPTTGSLVVSLRPEQERHQQGGPKKVKILVNRSSEKQVSAEYNIVIPFRTRGTRDGFHFVGVDETDTRYPHFYTIHSLVPGQASCIFPCIDDPGSRSFWTVRVKTPRTLGDALRQPLLTQRSSSKKATNDAARSTLSLTEEDKLLDMTVICVGNLVGEATDKSDDSKKIMTFDNSGLDVAAGHVGFAVGPFQHVDLWSDFRPEDDDEKLGDSAIKIHGYCLPGREEEVRFTCEAMAGAADFYAVKFGKYPFQLSYKMCFVDDMVADTVPLYSLSLCSNRLLYPPDVIDTEVEVTRKLAHALACQYFGVHIIPNTPLDTWITIGASHFMADMFMQMLCGNNDYRFRMKTRADRLVEEDVGRLPLDQLGNYLSLGSYQMDFMVLKAPLVLFILDRRLTKRATHNGLRRVIYKIITKSRSYAEESRIVNSDSFRKACEKVAHNSSSLEPFWQQWVHSSGCARFEMSQRYNKKHSRVDLTVRQPEDKGSISPLPLQKETFWGALQDRLHVPASKKENVSVWFTGPITIGIHEANGTPYEHVAEIRRTGPKQFKTIEMPYNTKYKRLKRVKRQKERAAATAAHAEGGGDNAEEAVLYSLGDVLQTPEDVELWQFADWTPEQEKSMEHDSFEWLRLDADFEWICSMKTNMQPWMYVSQLQQDRDVVAQQDSILYMSQKAGGEILASVLGRTLMDTRYFHGIRTQAVKALQRQTWTKEVETYNADTRVTQKSKKTDLGGLRILMMAFKSFFCYPDTQTPRPNDFSNKMQYFVQQAIPGAIARVRDKGRCPPEAQRFLLEQLRFNNNAENEYSDHFYVSSLLDALATSLVPDTESPPLPLRANDPQIQEDKAFLEEALMEIERYLRMDEWTNSYQNIWTTTALGCKQKLMKAGVIPISAIDFVQYLQDGTLDLIQIKAFEALVDLGFLLHKGVVRLLLAFMTTHHSPFVRDRLFQVFSWGVAALAFGEYEDIKKLGVSPAGDDDQDDDVLMMENADAIIEKKKGEEARRSNIDRALAELKKEFAKAESQDLLVELWNAICSPVIGLIEQYNLLDMCRTLFDADYSCRVTVRHPTQWSVGRADGVKPGSRLEFKAIYREIKKRPELAPAPPATASAAPVGALPGLAAVALPSKAAASPTVIRAPEPSVATPMEGIVHTPAQPKPALVQKKSGVKIKLPRPREVPQLSTLASPSIKTEASSAQVPPALAHKKEKESSALIPKKKDPAISTLKKEKELAASVHKREKEPPASVRKEKELPALAFKKEKETSSRAGTPLPSHADGSRTPLSSGSSASTNGALKKTKPSIKRKHDDADSESPRPTKTPRRILTFPRIPNYMARLRPDTQKEIQKRLTLEAVRKMKASSSASFSRPSSPVEKSARATPPQRKPLPSGGGSASSQSSSAARQHGSNGSQKVRKPLPSGAPAGTPPSVLPPLAPQHTAPSPASPSVATPTVAKPRIKLKVSRPKP